MKEIEKNDVDINMLFKWGTSMNLETPQGTVVVWLKLLGDADVNKARIFALRRSAEMRRKMADLESDERIALIPVLDTESKDKVVEVLLTLTVKAIADTANKAVEIKYPSDLKSSASLEEQEKYQQLVDDFPDYVAELHKKAMEKAVAKERKRLKRLSMEKLEVLYVTSLTDNASEAEMYRAFQDRSVWMACYQDENYILPMFAEFDDFINLPTEIKNQLVEFYGTLSIDIDTLKK